jgi:NAD(P)-dependent dehydrogenase (short-subunit alcohol dehydrogenase family)
MASLKFADKVVWITGASSGIGRCLALEFAKQGANVAVSARRVERLTEVVKEIEQLGRKAVAVPCDVTDEQAVKAAVEQVVQSLGKMDVAIANAGLGISGRIEDLSAEDWKRQLDTNVIGAALTARYALPELRKTKGRIALIASVAAMITTMKSGAYSASKAALRVIGQTLSMEIHGSGVSCTTVHPGFVESEIAQVDNQGVYDPAREDRRPKGLMWTGEQAAKVIVRAVYKREREFVFTRHGQLGAFLGQHMPGLVHFAMTFRKPNMASLSAISEFSCQDWWQQRMVGPSCGGAMPTTNPASHHDWWGVPATRIGFELRQFLQ